MKTDWSQLKFLSKDMHWGDPDLMSGIFMYALDSWCEFSDNKIFITPNGGTSGKHQERSLHYSGCAADFIVSDSSIANLLDIFISLTRFPFTEIGLYPEWSYYEEKTGGFHVGMDSNVSFGSQRRKLWLGVKDKTQKNVYLGLTTKNLKHYGVI